MMMCHTKFYSIPNIKIWKGKNIISSLELATYVLEGLLITKFALISTQRDTIVIVKEYTTSLSISSIIGNKTI